MELIRGLHNLAPRHRSCVATIGNFDGVHRGHQAVIAELKAHARSMGLPATVMVFEPQPREFFQGAQAPARITTFAEKLFLLREAGVDRVLCLQFNQRLRSLSAEAFVQDVLVDGLGIRFLAVGDDFRFGCDRKGDFDLLAREGARLGFAVHSTATLQADGARISSTAVRACLDRGDLDGAAALLGRPYCVTGRIGHGDGLGRQIGVPTANVLLKRRRVPLRGVFAVRVYSAGLSGLPGVANLGSRPTVGGGEERLEVHLFDFSGDLYGSRLRVEFVARIRGEEKFDGLDALRTKINEDMERARSLLGGRGND